MTDEHTTPARVHAVLARLRTTYAQLADLVMSSSGQEALTLAGECAEALREMSDDITKIRNQFAAELWESEKLSLAVLAGRIGVSKTRADQIIRAARVAKAEEESQGG